jgi:hypothetical protein
LTGDALGGPFLADIALTVRKEPVSRRHLDTEEPAASHARPRTRDRDSPPSLRCADVAIACLFLAVAMAHLLPVQSS